jgi:hypothetical protein
MTSEMGTYTAAGGCQFSNSMSSSQFQCHRHVIDDTKVRIWSELECSAASFQFSVADSGLKWRKMADPPSRREFPSLG